MKENEEILEIYLLAQSVQDPAHHLEAFLGAPMRNLERHRVWQRQNRMKRKASGKCVDCANPEREVIEGNVLCSTCKDARMERNFKRTLRLSQEDFARWQAKRLSRRQKTA